MENTKHTPGPWTITSMTKLGDLSGKVYEIGVMPKSRYHSQHVAKCWDEKEIGRNGGLTIDEAKANAKLISAAPDLLESLQWAINNLNSYDKPSDSEIEKYNKAIDAIKKATE